MSPTEIRRHSYTRIILDSESPGVIPLGRRQEEFAKVKAHPTRDGHRVFDAHTSEFLAGREIKRRHVGPRVENIPKEIGLGYTATWVKPYLKG